LANQNLQKSIIKAGNFRKSFWQYTDLSGAILTESLFETSMTQVNSVAFSPDGKYFVPGESSGIVRIWQVSSGREIQVFIGHKDWVSSVAYSPDGKQLASGSDDNTIKLWNSATGECLLTTKDVPYLGMNITGAIGLTDSQKFSLKLLGTVDYSEE
jgi:WD40 repeat protein